MSKIILISEFHAIHWSYICSQFPLKVNFEIVKLSDFSGERATIYSVILKNDEVTLLDHFIEENEHHFPNEVEDIVRRIRTIGRTTGARGHFFKQNEGFLAMVYVLCMIIRTATFGCIVSVMGAAR